MIRYTIRNYPDKVSLRDGVRELHPNPIRAVLRRLAAYEDTGMTPEEARAASDLVARLDAVAKPLGGPVPGKKNHVLIKPCEVGDLLYEIDAPEYGVITCKVLSVTYYHGPIGHIPGAETVADWAIEVVVVAGHGRGSSYNFEGADFGKTVFLTPERAHAAIVAEG